MNNGVGPIYHGITAATPVIDLSTNSIYVVQPGEGAIDEGGRSPQYVQQIPRL